MTDQNVNTAGTDLTYAEAMAFAKTVYGIDTAAGYVQQDQWTKRYESAAGQVDIEMWGARQYRVKLVEPLTIKPAPVVVTMDELYADTDAASVIEQPAPTFDDLRAATDAANAVELAAHNALVQAENAYASAAEVDPNDRHGWNRATGRFARTKAGQQLHAALTEARKVLREAVRVDTEACRKTWVNGFGTLNAPAEQPAPVDPSDLALDPVTDDYQEGYSDGIEGLPIQPNRFGLYNAGYVDGQADALPTDAAAEIVRLNRIITDLQADLHACERGRKATEEAWAGNDEAARAEIGQLRGELFAERNAHAETTKALREVLGGHAVTEVRQVEDGTWVAVGKSLGVNYQSIEYRTKDEAYAEATMFADRHNRQLDRARR